LGFVLAAVGLLLGVLPSAACDKSTTTPSQIVTTGSISKSPEVVGIAHATAFTFQANGFGTDDGRPLTFEWDMGDETPFADPTRFSGPAVVTHTYPITGVFVVRLTAKSRTGESVMTTLRGVEVVSLSGIWGVLTADGSFYVRNTNLNYNKEGINGNDTSLNCRFEVLGSVTPPRSVRLTWTRPERDPQRDCQGRGLPVSALPVTFTFTGTVDASANGMTGTLNDGRAVTLIRCQRLSCF
jgi:hypothetical protein